MSAMAPVRFFFDRGYDYGAGLPISQVHGFRLDKPSRIREAMRCALDLTNDRFEPASPVSVEALARVHSPAVLSGLRKSRSIAKAAELGPLAFLPAFLLRRAVVDPQLRATSGTTAALRAALDEGAFAFNCSGGYHHARPDLSHGFCLVNDVAVGIATVRAEGRQPRVLVLDLDLHQGDGNAAAFFDDDEVFTASLHEEAVFPFPKLESTLDVGLRSRVGDDTYLEAVSGMLTKITESGFTPDVIMYVAGTDPYADDPLGSLRVSSAGLLERDRRVARFARRNACSLVALPAGGYTAASPGLSARGFAAMAAIAEEPAST